MINSTTVFPFQRLPLSLFQEIQEFLNNGDYADFMRTSKRLFEGVKKETYRLTIRSSDMKKFLFDLNFRDAILSKIKDPRLQLCLTYTFPAPLYALTYRITHKKQTVLQKLLACQSYKLVIKENTTGIEEIPGWINFLNQRTYVRLERNETLKRFEGLKSLKHLKLQNFNALSDISNLSCLISLSLRSCPSVKDVSALKKLKKVVLEFCDEIEDISPLGHVCFIAINSCENITKISSLTNNEKVSVFGCHNITDARQWKNEVARFVESDVTNTAELMAGFPNAEVMTLFDYIETRNVSIGSKLKCLKLDNSFLRDMTSLSSLFTVVLYACNNMKMLNGLETVQNLSIKWCSALCDISNLGKGNRNVLIESCRMINDFSSLREVPRVRIKRCCGFTNGYDIAGAKIIIVDSCSNITDVSMLGNAEQVELQSCDGITSLRGFENVPMIVIENCGNLISLKGLGLGRNEYITLDYETDDEDEWEDIGEDEEEEEDSDNDTNDYRENERADKDDRDVKPFHPHPLVEDLVLKEYYQLIGFSSCPSTGRTSYRFGKKR
jgi:hypothetical protein